SGAQPSRSTSSTASPTTGSPVRPVASPTGVSIRLSDGRGVAAVDPRNGGVRTLWPAARLSLEGDWTLVVTPGPAGQDTARATWVNARGEPVRSEAIPAGLRPALTSAEGG